MMTRTDLATLFLIAAMAAAVPTEAQVVPGSANPAPLATGIITDVTSRSDPSQRYAMFIPSWYDPAVEWPVVLIMDARGRAMIPLERMAPAAEALGYVLMSSYGTESDATAEPNERAVAAMIEDAHTLFNVNTRRFYFAGHSGTARQSWVFAEQYPEHTAGIIGFGAGLPGPAQLLAMTLEGAPSFVFFGGAGDTDYNYEEVRHLDWTAGSYGLTYTVAFYPGPHAWPLAPVFSHALEWMEVQAVRSGLTTRSLDDVDHLYARSLLRAREREAAGDVEAAWRMSARTVADFRDLVNVDEAEDRRKRLEKEALAETGRLRAAREERRQFDSKMADIVERVQTSGRPLDVRAAARELRLEDLMRRSQRMERRLEALAAQRMLESVYVRASFYRPREAMAAGEWAVANAYLRLAAVIRPRDPFLCLDLGRTYAQMGDVGSALDSLECAVEGDLPGVSELVNDPLLTPLREERRFRVLLGPLPDRGGR